MNKEQDLQAVKEVIQEWMAALNECDNERVKKVWDESYDGLTYIAEENNDALHGWSGVDSYYNGLADVTEANWEMDNLKMDVIGDVAWVYITYVVEADIKSFNRTVVFPGRNTFILRKVNNQWKIIHYHESLSRDESRKTWDWYFEK